jgi:hypothetical protein
LALRAPHCNGWPRRWVPEDGAIGAPSEPAGFQRFDHTWFTSILGKSVMDRGDLRELTGQVFQGAERGLAPAEFALAHNSYNLKLSPIDLQPLTTIQQNNFTPQPPHSRDPLTLTICVTTYPSTTSRQHYFHRTPPLYMERRIYFSRGRADSVRHLTFLGQDFTLFLSKTIIL